MEFHLKGTTIWLPEEPFKALELINSITENPRRAEWVMRIDGVEKTLQEWFDEGVEVDSNTFMGILSEE